MHTLSSPALEAQTISYGIQGSPIVQGFHLQLLPGQVLGLIGPNGAGKTTVVDMLSGFSFPDKGTILMKDHDVTRLAAYRRTQRGLARSFQEAPAVPFLTVYEHIELACKATEHLRNKETSPDELLARFGLEESRDRFGTDLRTDSRRLLDIARAMGTCPSILLLDEPFSGLEAAQVALVSAEIRQLRAKGVAILIVEHRLAQLDGIVDSVEVIVAGYTIAKGSLSEVLHTPEVQQAYLGIDHHASRGSANGRIDQ